MKIIMFIAAILIFIFLIYDSYKKKHESTIDVSSIKIFKGDDINDEESEKREKFFEELDDLKNLELEEAKFLGEKAKRKSALYKEAEELVTNEKRDDINDIRYSLKKPSIEDVCLSKENFKVHLLKIIDSKGLKDSDVYNKARISRQVFNNIINKEGYIPTRITIFKLILALELDVNEAKELMDFAGLSFRKWSIEDTYIHLCIERQFYNIDKIIKEINSFNKE